MKKMMLASLLAATAVSAAAEWVKVHAVANVMTAYTDLALFKRNGDIVSMVMLYSLDTPQTTKAGVTFSSNRVEMDLDCKNSKKHGKTIAFFTSKMAQGVPVQSATLPVDWMPVGANDPSLPELAYGCKLHP
jgi:hypothetical protein